MTSSHGKPDEPYPFRVTVPPGRFARLLGVGGHQPVLAQSLGSQAEVLVGVALSVADSNPARPKQAGPVLLATIDGVVIGGLSQTESIDSIALVLALLHAGRPIHAVARIRRSAGGSGCICSVAV
ncbi:MAG: hypothetical protein QOJ11_3488 [Frankiales bacterium]|jgi:hypothetical protein|nr:hypothetical protein [Frankiales bacterium]